jgi:hypothetical protein
MQTGRLTPLGLKSNSVGLAEWLSIAVKLMGRPAQVHWSLSTTRRQGQHLRHASEAAGQGRMPAICWSATAAPGAAASQPAEQEWSQQQGCTGKAQQWWHRSGAGLTRVHAHARLVDVKPHSRGARRIDQPPEMLLAGVLLAQSRQQQPHCSNRLRQRGWQGPTTALGVARRGGAQGAKQGETCQCVQCRQATPGARGPAGASQGSSRVAAAAAARSGGSCPTANAARVARVASTHAGGRAAVRAAGAGGMLLLKSRKGKVQGEEKKRRRDKHGSAIQTHTGSSGKMIKSHERQVQICLAC